MESRPLKRKVVLLIIGSVFSLALIFALSFACYVVTPKDKTAIPKIIQIPEGLSFRQVADILEKNGLITRKSWFLLWGRVLGCSRNIKSGEYSLSPSMAPIKVLNILARGAIVTHPVTIPEGFTARQIADLLSRKGIANAREFMACVRDSSIVKKYDLPGPTLEGYLYPDTYHFARGIGASRVIEIMVRRFLQVMEPYRQRIKESGMDLREVITLASIVEKETGAPEERPLIASVFFNRLKKGMRLESDPTVIYGLKSFDGNLTRRHLGQWSPYNTYVIKGLPPGPIANPGLSAIKAVLYPAETKYLYFVSRNDGTHYFSRSLVEHNRAVQTYQKRARGRKKIP